jgi:hypothetical protein
MLPCITLCPLPGFKNNYDVFTDIESYVNDTYGMEDIFDSEMLENINDSKKWISKEIFTTVMGRCSMTCFNSEVKVVQFIMDSIYVIKTKLNYQVKS